MLVSASDDELTARRPPLLPSGKNNTRSNNNVVPSKNQSKRRHVSSRSYISPSPSSILESVSSRKFGSSALDPKQAEVSRAVRLLLTSSRSLAVSFQGESYSLPISRVRPGVPPVSINSKKATPENQKSNANTITTLNQAKNSSVTSTFDADQSVRPARYQKLVNNTLSNSLDCNGSNGGSGDMGRLSLDSVNSKYVKATMQRGSDEVMASDSDSTSSDSSASVKAAHNVARGRVVSARFWQETNSRLRRLQDPGLLATRSPIPKQTTSSNVTKSTNPAPLSFPRSPSRGGMISPLSSPSRGNHSPSQIRNAVSKISTYSFNEPPSVLSFARERVGGEDRRDDAHSLRILYNRHLQLRFINAKTEAVSMAQKHNADKYLWNAWITISDLRDTVTRRRHRLQLLKQKLKLAFILKGQITSLEDWTLLDKDQSTSLRGIMEALKASTIRLPLVERATANLQSTKDAIGSAAYVMEAIVSSLHRLLPSVEEINSLVTEIAKVTFVERALLEQCRDYISLLETMQINESSLRTQLLQHNRVTTARHDVLN